jgi:hypothetical protein
LLFGHTAVVERVSDQAEIEYALPTVIFCTACPSRFNSKATRRETRTVGGHTPTMMHASFQTGGHYSIGLKSGREDSGFVLRRKVTDCLEPVHLLTPCRIPGADIS